MYESSSVRMRKAIHILKNKENETLFQTYAADFRKAFGIEEPKQQQEKLFTNDQDNQIENDNTGIGSQTITKKDFFLYRFFLEENKDVEDDEDKLTIKQMVDIQCKKIVDEEDLDVICGQPQISGKEAALQMEQAIMEKMKEKHKRNQNQSPNK